MKRLRLSCHMAVLTVVILGVFGGAARAYFTAQGAGTASVSVGTLSPPSDVTATGTSGRGTVPIIWNAPSTGISPQGYYLLRIDSNGSTAAACATSASAPTTDTSCEDRGVPDGTYTYRVIATYRSFTASTASPPITVVNDTTAPRVTVNQKAGQSDPTNTLPMLWTVTFSEPVSGFDTGDLTRGGTSKGAVDVTGRGSSYEISLSGGPTAGQTTFSIGAGGAQDLAGNTNAASTSTDDSVTYDSTVPALTLATPTHGTSTNSTTPVIGGAAGDATGDSTIVTVKIYSGAGTGGSVVQTLTPTRLGSTWSTTPAPLAKGTYTAQATQTDAATNVATTSASRFAITASAPALSSMQMFDADADGKIDEVKATFTKKLVSSTATSPWTLANVPSAGNLHSVSTSGTVATLTLTPGSGGADTDAGSFEIALAASATGIRDQADNQASFAATAPDDLAGPVLMTATSGGATADVMERDDTFVLTFSEALTRSSVPRSFVVTEQRDRDPAREDQATLTIPGLITPARISKKYLSRNSSVTSNRSPAALSLADTSITVTLGDITGNGAAKDGTGGAVIAPAGSLHDPAGNAARTTARTMSRLF